VGNNVVVGTDEGFLIMFGPATGQREAR